MHFVHELAAQSNGSTTVVNKLAFSGLLAPVFGRLIGKGIAKSMPSTLGGLKKYVEAKS
jgi:hypothetical protein